MTQRNLKALLTKTQELTIGDLTLTVPGLTFAEMGEFAQIGERDKHAASKFLVRTTLRKCFSEAELPQDQFEELCKTISAEASLKIINLVVDLSGLGSDDTKKSVIPV